MTTDSATSTKQCARLWDICNYDQLIGSKYND